MILNELKFDFEIYNALLMSDALYIYTREMSVLKHGPCEVESRSPSCDPCSWKIIDISKITINNNPQRQ